MRPDNRAWRLTLQGTAAALIASTVAGCSLTFPISGFKADDTPTGSIDRTAAFLPLTLDREDLRRAKAALAVTLDPQGNGARVSWANPQSGASGSFAASAAPYTDHDRVCRAFVAEVAPAEGAARRLSGSACRDGDGTWEVRGVEDRRKA